MISKTLSNGVVVPAADFNASCYHPVVDSPPPYLEECRYADGATVSSVLFTKFAGHRKDPTYDNIVMRAYDRRQRRQGRAPGRHARHRVRRADALAVGVRRPRHRQEGAGLVAHKAASTSTRA